jgi:hypothetical protein
MDRSVKMERMAARVAFRFYGGQQGDDPIFDAAFSALRQKAKDYKDGLEQSARESLQKSLIKCLTDRGYEVISVDISLGKYRGSRFVTSAKVKVRVKDRATAKGLVEVLRQYHPRYALKSLDNGEAEYNFR